MNKGLKIIIAIFIVVILVTLVYFLGGLLKDNKEITDVYTENSLSKEKELTKLEDLPEDYSIEQAIEDGYFVISYKKIYNIEKLNEFIENTNINSKNRKEDTIRIIQFTTEGDIIIKELSYNAENENYILKIDSTRDRFSAESDRKITVNDDIPGKYFTISKVEEDEIVKVELSLCAVIDYVSTTEKIYEDIPICLYSASSEKSPVSTVKAVVIRVNEKTVSAMGIENIEGIFSARFGENGNIGFKQGQEILIYFNGSIMETYPAQLGEVYDIKILKEKSDVEIPKKYLNFYYSSQDKVKVTINELKNTSLTLTIEDTNELPYDYSSIKYSIQKKVKNEDYTGIGYVIGENTENSTAGYTRNRC